VTIYFKGLDVFTDSVLQQEQSHQFLMLFRKQDAISQCSQTQKAECWSVQGPAFNHGQDRS